MITWHLVITDRKHEKFVIIRQRVKREISFDKVINEKTELRETLSLTELESYGIDGFGRVGGRNTNI